MVSIRQETYSPLYIYEANIPDLSVFDIERIQNFRVMKLCERSYRPGSDSFFPAERFRILFN